MSRQVNLGQIVPNIQIGTTTTVSSGTSASVENVGTALNPILNFTIPKGDAGAIKMIIVNELPSTGQDDTIYLVPITGETSNNYDEYVYVNNQWEKLGGIQVEVDLTDYVKNTDYATSSKGGVIKQVNAYGYNVSSSNGGIYPLVRTKAQYDSDSDYIFIGKGTLENVITGKGLVSNTDKPTTTTGGVIKIGTYGSDIDSDGKLRANVYDNNAYPFVSNNAFISKGTLENRIGAIDEVIDNINGEVI